MEQLTKLWSQHQTSIAVGGAVLLVLILLLARSGRRKLGKQIDPKLADDLSKGNYEAAAERELKAGRLRQAYDLFLRAQRPTRAAHIAVRQGRLQDAAELFEKAGNRKRAADLYQQVGMKPKAEELLAAEEKSASERGEQKAALRKRLQQEPADDEDKLEFPEPVVKPAQPDPSPTVEPAAAGLDLGAVAKAPPAGELNLDEAAQPSPPSRFGIQALVDEAAEQAASQELAMAATQAAMAPLAAAVRKSIVSRGVEQEDLALHYVADSAVIEARQGPAIEDLQGALALRGGDAGAEDLLYQLGLALVGAGRWQEAGDAFARVERVAPGYRDAAARAQELVRWQGAVGKTELSLSQADGKATRYTLLGELGRGGMAVVYRARDEALGREVALKFMAEGMGNDLAAVTWFQREARAVAQLSHPNIVTLYDVGEQGGKAFICMELVDGSTVEKMVEKSGPLAANKAAGIIEQVLDAIEFAHSKQTIHRDIKPANVMLTRDGTVKVMDFGLAKRVEGPDKTTMIAGSPPYMAPEQFAGKDLDGRTDLFAVGASLYEMLTGQLPFPGMARFDPPKSMRELNPAIPVALDTMVMRALEFEKENRFASAAEMAAAVRAFLETAGPVGTASAATLPAKPAPKSASAPEPAPVVESPFSPEPLPAEVEVAPQAAPRAARTTPRTPIPVVGPSVGAYRMVRPSEPDVFTPPPVVRSGSGERSTPTPARVRLPSGEQSSGVRRPATPGPRLSLGTKLGAGGTPPEVAESAPTARGTPPPVPGRPATPFPAPRTSKDTALGVGPTRTGK